MKQVYRSAGLSCIVALVALGCSKKTEPANEASATSASGAPASGSPAAPAGAFTSKVAASCKLPEPAPKKLGAPDPAYAALFDAVAKAEPQEFGRSKAGDTLVYKAKDSVPDSNEAPAGVIAACVAGLDHASAPARSAAADCLFEIGYSIKDTAPVVLRLLEKLEVTKDESERDWYATAVGRLTSVEAGYTCRVLRLVAKLPKSERTRGSLVSSLKAGNGLTNNEGFDFAYELMMADAGSGPNSVSAMEVLTHPPEARKGEVCERLGAILKAGVDGWGNASTAVWKDETCKQRDAVVANAVTKLKWLETPTDFKEIDRPLLNANYIEDLPGWPGLSAAQKKSVCDAAKSLEAKGKLDDAKAMGKKITAVCAK